MINLTHSFFQVIYYNALEEEQPIDVLDEHRNKRRAPRPPNPETFHRQPIASQPVARQPIARQPVAHHVAHQPVARQPVPRQPVPRGLDSKPNGNNNAENNFDGDIEDNVDNDDDDEGLEDSTNRRRTSNEAETLKFYPPGWRVVITKAKQYWRLHVATKNPFPNRAEHLEDAAALLTRAINEYQEEDGVLESGLLFFCFFDID